MCLRHTTFALGEVAEGRLYASEVAPEMLSKVVGILFDPHASDGLLTTFHRELASYCFT
jgi:hypothetical protein